MAQRAVLGPVEGKEGGEEGWGEALRRIGVESDFSHRQVSQVGEREASVALKSTAHRMQRPKS